MRIRGFLEIHAPWILLFAVFVWCFLAFLNAHFPILGHDYHYFLPKLLMGKWHFLRQGFLPFRFTPHICAGLPMYGNPQDLYYSLPQLLSLILDPWLSVNLTVVIMLFAGYAGWYLVGRDLLRLPVSFAHLLSLVILSQGFFLVHMIAGHLSFHTFPLMGWVLWLLYHPSHDVGARLIARSSTAAAILAIMLYGGGVFAVLFTLLACALIVPIDLLLHPSKARVFTLVLRFALAGGLALGLAASKLAAVYGFMRFFPRIVSFNHLPETMDAFSFVMRALFALPQRVELFAGLPWSAHEYSHFLSPVVLLGVASFFVPRLGARRNPLIAAGMIAYVLILTMFFLQFTRGYGFLVSPLEQLPIFSSIHVTTRFLYLLSIGFAVAGIYGLSRAATYVQWHSEIFPYILGLLTVILFLIAYKEIIQTNAFWMQVPYQNVREAMASEHPYSPSVNIVEEGEVGLLATFRGVTSVRCYEPLFSYDGSLSQTRVRPGRADLIFEGAYNLNNPACLQYPEANDCQLWDRISVSDATNFERFRAGERTTWILPWWQRTSDGISIAALAVCIAGLAGWRKRS